MKILDIPQSGKRGLNVSQGGRYGQISRALVIPTNPRTPAQMQVRSILSSVAKRWDTITEPQRQAWIAAAAQVQSKSRLGQRGPLTGNQLFMKVNATLQFFGEDPADTPPATPQFEDIPTSGLTITNTAGVIALKLGCPNPPGEDTVIRASAPRNSGVSKPGTVTILGVCPAPVGGSSDITALYTAKYGVPPVGKKVFVLVNRYQSGFETLPVTYSAFVPEAS
jgi:hypothetical protein